MPDALTAPFGAADDITYTGDEREIIHFRRFLAIAGPAPLPGENSGFLRVYRGWLPYVLGHFFWSGVWGPHERSLAPPEGYDDVPITAWTFPG